MTRAMVIVTAALLAGCGGGKSLLTQDAFNTAARDCGAKGATFFPAATKDDAPEIRVPDTVAIVNGHRTAVAQCVAAKLAPYRYARMELEAANIKPAP